MRREYWRSPSRRRVGVAQGGGFTLIELVAAIAIFAILMSVAIPSYRSYVVRTSREGAKAELIELAGLQERIFLNANAYSSKMTDAYNGTATGGLGVSSGTTRDGRYGLSVTVNGTAFTLTATPVSNSIQSGDGNLTIDSAGRRTWGSKVW